MCEGSAHMMTLPGPTEPYPLARSRASGFVPSISHVRLRCSHARCRAAEITVLQRQGQLDLVRSRRNMAVVMQHQ
jgi:hypothetical protein